jgi:hypothetical protein
MPTTGPRSRLSRKIPKLQAADFVRIIYYRMILNISSADPLYAKQRVTEDHLSNLPTPTTIASAAVLAQLMMARWPAVDEDGTLLVHDFEEWASATLFGSLSGCIPRSLLRTSSLPPCCPNTQQLAAGIFISLQG